MQFPVVPNSHSIETSGGGDSGYPFLDVLAGKEDKYNGGAITCTIL